jgi:hypothetical protein
MRTNVDFHGDHNEGGIHSITVLGARVTWTLLGPFVLLLTTWSIVAQGIGWLTWLDGLFVAVVGLMVLGRWIEQRSGACTTLTGEPSTPEQSRRYIVILLVVAIVVWLAANMFGNHLLN